MTRTMFCIINKKTESTVPGYVFIYMNFIQEIRKKKLVVEMCPNTASLLSRLIEIQYFWWKATTVHKTFADDVGCFVITSLYDGNEIKHNKYVTSWDNDKLYYYVHDTIISRLISK